LRNVQFERTPARVARGRYLVEGLLACSRCHSERDWSQPGAPPVAGREFAGHVFSDYDRPLLVAPNLTSDEETGVARWSDDMLARAIREGVGHDGRALHPEMWYQAFRVLSDEDVESIVVYLRTLPPVRNPLPRTQLSWQQRFEINDMPQPITAAQHDAPTPDRAKRGDHLENLADCGGCHTDWYHPGSAVNAKFMGGGNVLTSRRGEIFTPNLTRDPSGIGYYDEAMFIRVLRSGKVGARPLNAEMPWSWYRKLSDDDLKAIFAWTRAQDPVRHIVDNTEPPTYCPRCRQKHGGGKLNQE
jgi:cytochrome c553